MNTTDKKRDRVAIVGFAGTNRHLAPYDDERYEIWGLNEAHRQPWMRRITRWFQIHQQWDFTKANNDAYREHWEWLQEEHPFPIYMQEKYDEVPSSVSFPKQEVVDRFCQNYRRGRTIEESDVNEYFTSSFAFMCSLALLLDFKVIEVYGFEMATDTEYRYQKGSTEMWLGIAGQHAQILVQEECRLIQGALYGYEVSRMINRQRLEFLEMRFKNELKHTIKDMDRVNGRRSENDGLYAGARGPAKQTYAIRGRELLQAEIRSNAIVNEKQGRVNMIADLIKTVDNMHMGKDPGDGFFGPEGDLDPALEQQRQDEAQAAAEETAEEPQQGLVSEASEGPGSA